MWIVLYSWETLFLQPDKNSSCDMFKVSFIAHEKLLCFLMLFYPVLTVPCPNVSMSRSCHIALHSKWMTNWLLIQQLKEVAPMCNLSLSLSLWMSIQVFFFFFSFLMAGLNNWRVSLLIQSNSFPKTQ